MNQSDADQDLPAGNVVSSGDGEQRVATAPNNAPAIIGAIASQVVFITALLYYFGWVYAHNFFGYFGVDTSLVGYSTIDYVLRGINGTFKPSVYLAFVAFVLFNFHRFMVVPVLTRIARDSSLLSNVVSGDMSGRLVTPHYVHPRISRVAVSVVGWMQVSFRWRLGLSGVRRIIGALQVVANTLVVIVFTGVLLISYGETRLGLLLSLSLLLAVGLLGYIEHLHLRYAGALAVVRTQWSTRSSRAYTLILLMVGLLAGLWAVGVYAADVGTRSAAEVAAELPARSEITVYSTQRIALSGSGVVVNEITAPGSKYHYQYIGLRLLVRSSDKFLLLPSRWQRDHDRVFFLQDDNSVRIDVAV